MDITRQYQEQQEAKRLHDRISSFMENFKVGTLLNSSGIRKLRGVKPLALFTVIFTLPFGGPTFAGALSETGNWVSKRMPLMIFLKNPRYN